jgi:hypothetical protein
MTSHVLSRWNENGCRGLSKTAISPSRSFSDDLQRGRQSSLFLNKHLTLNDLSDESEKSWENTAIIPRTTMTSSSGQERELFWMKLLEEQAQVEGGESFIQTVDDDERDEDDFLSRRATLVGKEIHQSWSPKDSTDGSPLSMSSAFNDNSLSSNPKTESKDPLPSKVTTKLSPRETRRIDTLTVTLSDDLKTPVGRRSLGDVTNKSRFKSTTPTTPSKASREGNSDKKSKMDGSWIMSKQRHDKASSIKPKDDEARRSNTPELSTPARVTMKKYLNSSPLPPSRYIKSKSIIGKLGKVGPNPDDYTKFRWAYETWFQAGLMQDKGKCNNAHSRFWRNGHVNIIPKSLLRLSPEVSYCKENQNEIKAREVSVSTVEGAVPILKKAPVEDIDLVPSSSDDDEEVEFQQLLDMWRDQSKAKGGIYSKSALESARDDAPKGVDVRSTIHYHGQGSIANNRVKKQSKTKINLHDFSVPPSPLQLGELSAISVTSSEIVPYNMEGNGIATRHLVPSERSFTNFDMYDNGCHERDGTNRALVILQNHDRTFDVVVGDTQTVQKEQLVVRNLAAFSGSNQMDDKDPRCECSKSVFSGNDDLISFFLPQMGMACTCGHQSQGLINPDDPTCIENVLRPWQCEFLKSFGIYRGEELVKARHRSADILARGLRQWRKKNDMVPFKTSACGMALNIWAKTCKAYVRSIRKQILDGTDLLEHQPGAAMNELTVFLKCLPEAPPKLDLGALCDIEPESQVEV